MKSLLEFPEIIPFKFIFLFNSTLGLVKLSNMTEKTPFDDIFHPIRDLIKPLRMTKASIREEQALFDNIEIYGHEIRFFVSKREKRRSYLQKFVNRTIEPKPKFSSNYEEKTTVRNREIEKLLTDKKRIEELLMLKKQQLGLQENDLLFIGTANLAKYCWCAMKSVLHCRQNEIAFFTSYLSDRLSYTKNLSYISRIPKKSEDILRVGDEIIFEDIERLLKARKSKADFLPTTPICIQNQNEKIMVMPSNLSNDEREQWKEEAANGGHRIVEEKDVLSIVDELLPTSRGHIAEFYLSEHYPKIRWNFKIGNFICISVPDGITKEFVYEFKCAKNNFLMNFMKPVAMLQGDLYAFFFRKGKKRVQILSLEDRNKKTWEETINIARLNYTVEKFGKVEKGELPQTP